MRQRNEPQDRPPMGLLIAFLLLYRSKAYPDEDLSRLLGRRPDARDFAEAERVWSARPSHGGDAA